MTAVTHRVKKSENTRSAPIGLKKKQNRLELAKKHFSFFHFYFRPWKICLAFLKFCGSGEYELCPGTYIHINCVYKKIEGY